MVFPLNIFFSFIHPSLRFLIINIDAINKTEILNAWTKINNKNVHISTSTFLLKIYLKDLELDII